MKYVKIEGGKKLSSFISPMKATLSDTPAFDSTDWIYEIKWDGYRAIAEISKEGNKLYSRNGLTFHKHYLKIFESLNDISIQVILDGEIVVMDENGIPSFQKLQNYKNKNASPIYYYVFDCLEIEGKSIKHLPVTERKEMLQKILPENSIIKYCDHIENEGKLFFEHIQKLNLEGMIAKRKSSKYLIGKRSTDWLKIKNIKSQEAIIVGFTKPQGSRSSFGSLLLAVYKRKQLIYIGNVGTGFTNEILKDLHARLKKLVRKTSPLDVPIPEPQNATWVAPELVCNIAFSEITEEGIVRHASYQGLRIDKKTEEIQIEKATKTGKRKA
jgi:bifunctional non-homologous end joining protein LigD